MAVYVVNLVIDQGADFNQTLNLQSSLTNAPLNLVGYTGSAQLRKHSSSRGKYDLTVTFVDRVNGVIRLGLTDTITSRIKPGRYIYDIILTDGSGFKERIVEGSVLVREGATRE